jgi:hypothetical protein
MGRGDADRGDKGRGDDSGLGDEGIGALPLPSCTFHITSKMPSCARFLGKNDFALIEGVFDEFLSKSSRR